MLAIIHFGIFCLLVSL